MKKILVLILSILLICSCGKKMTAKDVVIDYLEGYRTHSKEVMDALDDYIDDEKDLSDKQKETYKEVLKKQYKNIKYTITNETYNKEEATVTVKVTVFDLYKAQKEADDYLATHNEEFLNDDNSYNRNKFLDYKLDLMNDYVDQVDYTIDFKLYKNESDNWEIKDLSKEDLEKIHGIYEYES